ncbi:MAG: hypothetical protein V4695_12565 [Pseudomonadota bacterium]
MLFLGATILQSGESWAVVASGKSSSRLLLTHRIVNVGGNGGSVVSSL